MPTTQHNDQADNAVSSAEDNNTLLRLCAARLDTLKNDRIVLYAGANLPSEAAMAAYSPALSAYPAMGPRFAKEQPDTDLVSKLEIAVENEVNALFGSQWAETRLANCTTANLAVFHAFSQPGDLLLAPAAAHGGHLSQRRGGTPELAGLKVMDLPYDARHDRLDAVAAAEMILTVKPRLVMLGRSVMIKADDIAPVVAGARQVGAKVIFDASHVLGLIAGGMFPNPLALGVDIMTSSTYKTFPGRPHSIIAGRHADDRRLLSQLIEGRMIANCDAGCLPSLLVTLLETRQDGDDYARQICRNTAAMAEALRAQGVAVIAAQAHETATHQLLIPMDSSMPAKATITALERHGILVGTCADPRALNEFALRVGTQFMTRQGKNETDFAAIARSLAQRLEKTAAGRMRYRG
ncbi:PLP-dependent transferase [Brenneria corticis]|uniref:Glycine hydroxymethyltransferase n=1 Tax=Brenneria corticis TaxID=2173106 RepID=A0A2U1TVM6_9GAMM|nr:PLP-dependent transferase [Brenneria sp. CFCC 11842]PWC13466.1 glycine hydroxymethyltransferase [Brenneria sp. CFCC 11842]